jgi:hypothetical protein
MLIIKIDRSSQAPDVKPPPEDQPLPVLIAKMANNYRHRFDFDIGYLVKSPCRECLDRHRFPGCMDGCVPLEKIHTVLANSISCSRPHRTMESKAIFQGSRDEA